MIQIFFYFRNQLVKFLTGSSINEHLATIMVGLVQLLSNIAALFIVDKSGRKPLLIISAVIMSLSMASMGTAFYLKQQNIESFGYVFFLLQLFTNYI